MRATIPLLVGTALLASTATAAPSATATAMAPLAAPAANHATKKQHKRVAKKHPKRVTSSRLRVSVTGTPKGHVKITGPKTHRTINASSVLKLRLGTYGLHPAKVVVAGDTYAPTKRHLRVKLHKGRTQVVTVRYTHVGSSAPSKAATGDASPTGELGQLVTLVNQARSQARRCGATSMPAVDPVAYDADLGDAAQEHAQDMATNDYFEHDSLDGRTFVDRIDNSGYDGQAAGENIATGYQTAAEVLQGWLDSPGHCFNLMNPDFDEMGLGFAVSDDVRYEQDVTYWVQDFGYATPAG